jgi:hypothetical protein
MKNCLQRKLIKIFCPPGFRKNNFIKTQLTKILFCTKGNELEQIHEKQILRKELLKQIYQKKL